MSDVDRMVSANSAFAERFDRGDVPRRPNRPVAIVTCIDARLHPERFLGLEIGDAHVIRNAGGRASDDALRSLIVSTQLLGTRELLVIHHTDCGMQTLTNEDARATIEAATGHSAADIDFLPFEDLEQSVRDDVATIRANPLVPSDASVTGWVYDVATGRLARVEDA